VKYKAVVFDMDGTLLDTLEDLADAMNRVLASKGLPIHPVESYRFFVGSGAANLVLRTLPADRLELADECLRDFLKEYETNWKAKTRLYEGVADLLDALAARSVPMAVLTNKPQEFAQLCMEAFLSSWDFAATVGQVPGVPVKPDPAGAREIMRRLGLAPQDFLYLGDTDVDMRTAVDAGMFPVGVLWGFRPAEELLAAGAATLIAHPLELLTFLD
jgi:phosphoglycolate phosphatase